MENNIQKAMKRDLIKIQKTFCVMLERAGRDVGETSEYWDIKLEEYIKQVQRNLLKAIKVEIKKICPSSNLLVCDCGRSYPDDDSDMANEIRELLDKIKESIQGKLEL